MNRSSQVGQLPKRLLHKAFYVRPLKQADIVFARSRHTRDELVNHLHIESNKIQVAYCGVQSVFAHIPRTSNGEISRLIYYGRIDPRKGVFDAIKALGQVAAKGITTWTFKIIGVVIPIRYRIVQGTWDSRSSRLRRPHGSESTEPGTGMGSAGHTPFLCRILWARQRGSAGFRPSSHCV